MRFIQFSNSGGIGLAVKQANGSWRGLLQHEMNYPGELDDLVQAGDGALQDAEEMLNTGPVVDLNLCTYLPPLQQSSKIICVGLNYADHTSETGLKPQEYPTIFVRFRSSLVAHGAAIVRPHLSEQLDYEGELVVIIGKTGRHIPKQHALEYVAGYAQFNDATLRDYQFKTSQWTVGKNFDATGGFGPELVTPDEVPPGARGLMLRTRLNGHLVQEASTADLIFDVATLISTMSEAFTLEPGDLIVTGTPAGVGMARKPPLWMKPGDVCEVQIEGFEVLRNSVVAESE